MSGAKRQHRNAVQRVLAALTVIALVAVPAPPAGGGLLGDALGGILDPVLDGLDPILDPVLGEVSDTLRIPLDETVDGLLDGTVDDLITTVDDLVIPDDGAPLTPPDFDDLAALSLLEPVDPIIEDVVAPDVLGPLGDALAPIAGAGGATAPFGTDALDPVVALVREALEPLDLDAAAYVVRTQYRAPAGTIVEHTQDAVVDVPALVDVSGDGLPDISVELRIVTARPSLRVLRLPTAPADLPVSVEGIIAPGGWGASERLSVGFDALDDELPAAARATIVDDGTQTGNLAADLHTTDPGASLALIAGIYDQGADDARVDPTDVRIDFAPVPVDVTLAAEGVTGGFEDGRVAITTSEPSRVEAAVLVGDGSGDTTEVAAIIDRVPGAIDIGVEQVGSAGVTLAYEASGLVDRIALRLAETTGGITRSAQVGFEGVQATAADFTVSADDLSFSASAPIEALTLELVDPTGIVDRATTLRARLEDLPDTLDIDLGDGAGTSLGLDAGPGVLGLLEVQLTSGPDTALAPGIDGVLLTDTADDFITFVRLSGLRSVAVSAADGLAAQVETLGGQPFAALVTQGGAGGTDELVATLSALPASVDVAVTDTVAGTELTWLASSVVGTLDIHVAQAGGLTADLVVRDLPTSLAATLDDVGIDWSASDGVPEIQAQITDPSGLAGRATEVRARLADVPASFSVDLSGGGIGVDARPGTIGLVDVLATDGTTEIAVPDGVDGLVLVDDPDGFAAAARMTGLRALGFTAEPVGLELVTTGGRVFEVDVRQSAADGSGTDVRATIDALPSSLSLGLAETGDGARLDYTASATVDRLLASIDQRDGSGGSTTIGLEVHDLPAALSLTLGDAAVTYHASSTVPLLRAEVVDPGGLAGGADRLLLELVDLPTDLTVGLSEAGALSFDAHGGAVGSLEALLTSGPELALPPGIDGLLLIDAPDDFVAAVRITGLRHITFDPADGTAFSLGTVGGRVFEVDIRQANADGSSTDVRATLDRLPADVTISLGGDPTGGLELDYTGSAVMEHLRASLVQQTPGESPTTAAIELDGLPTALSLSVAEGGSVGYDASARVARLAVDIDSPDGLFDRATTLRLLALDLPTGITAQLTEDGSLAAETTGGSIGLLEALITSGAELGLDGAVDGLVLRDTADDFAVFVRITGLSGIGFGTADGGATLSLDTDGGRILEVDALTENVVDGTSTGIRATLDALPASVELTLTDDPDGRGITYAASAEMARLYADLVLADTAGTNTFTLEILGLPQTIDLDLAASGAISYAGSGRADQLAVLGENPDGMFLRATRLQALLQDLPPTLDVVLGEDGGLLLDAGASTLGHLDVLATNGLDLAPDPGVVGAIIRDTADDFVVSLRFDDARRLAVNPDPVAIEVATAGGQTLVVQALLDGGELLDLGDGAISIEAVVDVLPADVTLGFGLADGSQQLSIDGSSSIDAVSFQLAQTPDAAAAPLTADLLIEDVPTSLDLSVDISGEITYAASAPVPLLAIDAVDPAGLFDRATDLGLRLEDLPLGLDLAISDAGAVMIDTTGGKLGQIEALITDGADNRVPVGFDGILFEDLDDRFVVSARFTNLYSGDVAQVPQPRVALTTDGGRPLSLGLYESAPGKPSRIPGVAYTEASLLDLPPQVDLELLDGAPGTINIAYDASATADALSLETNAGNRWVTEASISNPVPRHFLACQAGDGRCADSGRSNASVGSFRFIADQHTTLNVLDCAAPLNSGCTRQNGSKLTSVENLRVKSFGFEADFSDCGFLGQQACGHLFADTLPDGVGASLSNADTLKGRIFNKDGSTELTLDFGTNFKAAKRLVVFEKFPNLFFSRLRTTKTGSVSCTSGTGINIRVQLIFTLNLNGNSLLC